YGHDRPPPATVSFTYPEGIRWLAETCRTPLRVVARRDGKQFAGTDASFFTLSKGRLEVFRPGPSYRRSPCGTRTTSEMTRRCSRIRSAATAFMTAAREACRELRCMVEAINADRAARPFLIAAREACPDLRCMVEAI